MRSQHVDLKLYKELCENSFEKGTWPKVNNTNNLLGGSNLEAFNIILTNGCEDPWKWAGITKSKGRMIAHEI